MTHLRSEPLSVSKDKAQKVFRLDKDWRPLEYIQNNYEDRGEVVIDHATGLTWQRSGSDEGLGYNGAPAYIKKLNHQRFAGYDDWRLPTIEELMSLLEPKNQSNGLFFNPIFDAKQHVCWSADKRSSGSVWSIGFYIGVVHWGGGPPHRQR